MRDYNELAVEPLSYPPQFDRNYSFSRYFPKPIYHSIDRSFYLRLSNINQSHFLGKYCFSNLSLFSFHTHRNGEMCKINVGLQL